MARRIAVIFGAGVAIWFTVDIHSSWPMRLLVALFGAVLGVMAGAATRFVLTGMQMSLPRHPGRAGAQAVAYLAAGAGLLLMIAWVRHTGVPVLPALCVLVFGLWLVPLVYRHLRPWFLTDLLAALVLAAVMELPFSPDLMDTATALGFLLPVGAALSVNAWRAIGRSKHLPVKVSADVVFSVLLGTVLVLALVWWANVFGVPPAVLAAVRDTLERVGELAELPWWVWVVVYLLLAVAAVLVARRRKAGRWLHRTVLPVNVTKRALTIVHLTLLIGVLVGVAAPPALNPAITAQLHTRYTVALQDARDADAERAAAQEIRRAFTAPPPGTSSLAAVVSAIHAAAAPAADPEVRLATERELAHRMGADQAAALRLPPARQAAPAPAAPIRDVGDLDNRIDQTEHAQQSDDTAHHNLDQAAELAAVAVAGVLQFPDIGHSDVLQIVREYLGGLVEAGPVKTLFSGVADRVKGSRLVVPDLFHLELAAAQDLSRTEAKTPPDRIGLDPVFQRSITESPATAAADLANEARFLQDPVGPCAGCAPPVRPGEEDSRIPGGHDPVREEPVPEIHVR